MMPVECGDICAAADAQPFLNKVFQFGIDCMRVLTSDACGMRQHLRSSLEKIVISYIRRNSVLAKNGTY